VVIGQSLDQRYRVVRELGEDDMGTRYLAEGRDASMVALTIIRSELASDDGFAGQFRREADLAASYPTHPNLVAVHEFGHAAEGRLFIAMEHLEGRPLDELLREGPVDVRTALWLGSQIAAGVAFAHQWGVLHTGLRPQHVTVVNGNPAVKLAHFAINRLQQAAAVVGRQGLRELIGVAEYMAPEQIEGDAITERTDVYALGVILYQMLTGRPPFTGGTPWAIFTKHLREAPTPVTEVRADVPPRLHALITQVLAKNPAARPSGMREVIEALGRIDGLGPMPTALPSRIAPVSDDFDSPDDTGSPPPLKAGHRPPPRRRLLKPVAISAGALIVCATTVVVGTTLQWPWPTPISPRHDASSPSDLASHPPDVDQERPPAEVPTQGAASEPPASFRAEPSHEPAATPRADGGKAAERPQRTQVETPGTVESARQPQPAAKRSGEPERQQEPTRQAHVPQQTETVRPTETLRQTEVVRQQEAARRAEAARQAEAAKQQEAARRAEAARQAEAARRAADGARQSEAAKVAHASREAETRSAMTARGRPELAAQSDAPASVLSPEDTSRLRTTIEQALRGRGLLRETAADRWGVTVEIGPDGIVTAAGIVRDRTLQDEAIRLIQEAAGTSQVRDGITRPDSGHSPPDAEATRIRTLIEQKLRSRGLLRESAVDRWGVTVDIDSDRVVSLAGMVRDQKLLAETIHLAREVSGVKEVRPNITVQERWQSQ
jgi:serine/threonine protein kinase/osmotically-inducible protein OsmY